MQSRILENHLVRDAEWAVMSSLFPAEPTPSALGGHPRLTNRDVFQALLRWLADGAPEAPIEAVRRHRLRHARGSLGRVD
jgi:hypothetical protein